MTRMKSMTLRGVDDQLDRALRERAQRTGDSINTTVLKLLREALDLGGSARYPEYRDLDELAGTWTVAERAEFDAFQEGFDRIDRDLWE